MSIITWIVLGLATGLLASKVVNKTSDGVVLNCILGLIGALGGGFCFNSLTGFSGMNVYSILVALAGALVVLIIFHAFLRRSVWRRRRSSWR
jgi:uncharacterized membrane protein YeaQ/YmgE (transglycosylase-associated protein family)